MPGRRPKGPVAVLLAASASLTVLVGLTLWLGQSGAGSGPKGSSSPIVAAPAERRSAPTDVQPADAATADSPAGALPHDASRRQSSSQRLHQGVFPDPTSRSSIDAHEDPFPEAPLSVDDIVLSSGSTLTGRVLHPDGSLATDTRVTAESERQETARLEAITDSDGGFRFPRLRPGRWIVRAEPGAVTTTMLHGGQPHHVELTLKSSGRVRGLVLGPGGPVAGASIQLLRDALFEHQVVARSDAAGKFSFDVIDRQVEVFARHAGRVSERVSVSPIARAETRIEIPFHAGVIRGQVVSAHEGSPIEGALVRVRLASDRHRMLSSVPSPPTSVTDANGRFLIGDLPPGRWMVTANRSWHVLTSVDVDLPLGAHHTLKIALEPAGVIQGEVVSGDGGAFSPTALRGLVVWAISRSDPDQRFPRVPTFHDDVAGFRFTRLPPGSWRLELRQHSDPPPNSYALPPLDDASEPRFGDADGSPSIVAPAPRPARTHEEFLAESDIELLPKTYAKAVLVYDRP